MIINYCYNLKIKKICGYYVKQGEPKSSLKWATGCPWLLLKRGKKKKNFVIGCRINAVWKEVLSMEVIKDSSTVGSTS